MELASSRLVAVACASVAGIATATNCRGHVPRDVPPGKPTKRWIDAVDPDPRLGSYWRRYQLHLPDGYTGTEPLPVWFYFHGQCDDWTQPGLQFAEGSNKHKFIMVRPKGMDDDVDGEHCVTWDVGFGGRRDVCDTRYAVPTQYRSCRTVSKTGPCDCYTCYDDVQFFSDLYTALESELCIDPDRVFITGASNGAMYVYYMMAQLLHRGLPPKIRAAAPWYGAFLKDMEDVPKGMYATSILHSHGLEDITIPPQGGTSYDSYFYVPVERTLEQIAARHGCGSRSPVYIPFEGRGTLTQCFEWQDCYVGRVVRCNFNEGHGFWPSYAIDMMQWFFHSVVSRDVPSSSLKLNASNDASLFARSANSSILV